jgi:TolB-like protein/DNA-binding winged helix-turn-helix (wHTH) protein/tetratricopeptide (TPR) repeat protein
MTAKQFDTNVASFQVGEWLVQPGACEITRGETVVRLAPKEMDLLQLLASRPGDVFTRSQIEDQVWPDVIVGYDSLTKSVGRLRDALGDTGRPSTYIQTVPKKGYRLIAEVSSIAPGSPIPDARDAPNAIPPAPAKQKRGIMAVAVLATVFVVIALALFTLQKDDEPDLARQAGTGEKPLLIVLPFKNLSGDPEQAYFSRGITDDLITDLSGYPGIEVISSRIAFQYNQPDVDLATLVNTLGVHYVVEGSIRRGDEQLRINVQMIDAQRGTNLWAEQYNRPLTSLFDIQDEVRSRVVSALSDKLNKDEPRIEQKRYTDNYHAYDLFLRGQSNLIKRASAEDNSLAREQLEQAIAIDPGFARAYAALAMVNADAFRHGWVENPQVAGRIALQQARYAVELDPELHFATLAMGYVEFFVAANHEQAAAMAERTLELDPKNADAHLLLATIYVHANEYKKAEAYVELSIRLNPTPPSIYFHIGAVAHLLQGDYPTALEMLEQSLMINPERLLGKIYLAIVMVRMGQLEDAQWYAEEVLALSPDFNAEEWANKQPFKDRSINRQLRDDLRKAGLE